MTRDLQKAFLILFIFVGNLLFSEPRALKLGAVRETMDELFSYHIEYKELSPLIIKRTFKNYIDSFDRSKLYLLDWEVHPFIHMSDERIQKIIANYQSENFSDFFELNAVLQKAVERSRQWRKEIEKELILNEPLAVTAKGSDSYPGYALVENELKNRIKQQLVKLLFEEKRQHELDKWTPQDRTKIFQLWERRFQKKEDPYLLVSENGVSHREKGEQSFCLHLIKAVAKSLDAHTSYFSFEEAEEMRTSLEKQFEGIGVVLREGIKGIFIVEMIKGSPAEKSGKILPGDMLMSIDDELIANFSFEEVLSKMKGKKPEIVLKLQRHEKGKEAQLYTVTLKREKILLNEERLNFSAEPFGEGIIGKLNLPSFYESGTASSAEKDMREAIKALKKQGKLQGLVIDLRENSGGFLSQAVKVASLFIIQGIVVVSKYSQGEMKYLREVDGRLYFDGPVVILTSKASASAAEIVAGALQDYGAALIVGDERTYGKGTIQFQTVTEQDAKNYFKVTVGRYYTVSGRSAQIDGIKADIIVPTELSNYNIGERFLEYPLPNDRIPPIYAEMDVEENKNWLQKNYLPDLKLPAHPWNKMIPYLSKNSFFRIHNDKNFSLFLKYLETSGNSKAKAGNWGNADLQLIEAVNILKDMIHIHNSESESLTQK